MDKADVLLAALACGNAEARNPENLQNLLFLFGRQFPEVVTPPFKFTVSGRGPFDPRIYSLIEELVEGSYLSTVVSGARNRHVLLTPEGRERATRTLAELSDDKVEYLKRAASFVEAKSSRVLLQIADRASNATKSGLRLNKSE